jgi:cellular nucleic acid-binding protein
MSHNATTGPQSPPSPAPEPGTRAARRNWRQYDLDIEKAKTELTEANWIEKDKDLCGDMMAKAIRKIVASNAVAQKKNLALKAVATLVGAVERNWETAMQVKEQEVGTHRALADAAEEALRERRQNTDWADRDHEDGEGVGQPSHGIQEQVGELSKQVNELKNLFLNSQGHATSPLAPSPLPPQSPISSAPSFAQVTASSTPAINEATQRLAVAKAAARTEIQERQVLITIPDKPTFESFKSGMGITAISRMKTLVKAEFPNEDMAKFDVRAVKFIEGNGMVLEMRNTDTAVRMRSEEMKRMVAGFGGGAHVKPRVVNVIVKFVPITLDLHKLTTISHVEHLNDLESGTIHKMSWCRKGPFPEGQSVGLLRIQLTSKAAANHIITHGLTIEHKRVSARRDIIEPLQCYNCQRYGHVGEHCRQGQEGLRCARCGGKHRLRECKERDKTYCVPCDSNTHSSHDKACPEQAKQAQFMALRDPSGNAPLFALSKLDKQVQWMIPSPWASIHEEGEIPTPSE